MSSSSSQKKPTRDECYGILGLDVGAPEEEVKRAYKKLALRTHPDKNPNDPTAGKKFLQISDAYKRIVDPDSFKDEDEEGEMNEEEMAAMFNSMLFEMFGGFGGPDFFEMMMGDEFDDEDEDDSDDEYGGGLSFMEAAMMMQGGSFGDDNEEEMAELFGLMSGLQTGGMHRFSSMGGRGSGVKSKLKPGANSKSRVGTGGKGNKVENGNRGREISSKIAHSSSQGRSSSYSSEEQDTEGAEWETDSDSEKCKKNKKKGKTKGSSEEAMLEQMLLEAAMRGLGGNGGSRVDMNALAQMMSVMGMGEEEDDHDYDDDDDGGGDLYDGEREFLRAMMGGKSTGGLRSSPRKEKFDPKKSSKASRGFASTSASSDSRISVGDRVLVHKKHLGVARYVGSVTYGSGTYVGVEMDDSSVGKNNGNVKGSQYFSCPKGKGLMVKDTDVHRIER